MLVSSTLAVSVGIRRTDARALPLAGPGVRHAADDGGEHERRDEGEEHQIDEALHAVVAQARQSLHVVLQRTGRGRP